MNSIKQLALLIALVSLSISVNAISKCPIVIPDMADASTPFCCDLQGGKMIHRAELFKCEFPQTPENDEKFEKEKKMNKSTDLFISSRSIHFLLHLLILCSSDTF
jgi:hypothetical protein